MYINKHSGVSLQIEIWFVAEHFHGTVLGPVFEAPGNAPDCVPAAVRLERHPRPLFPPFPFVSTDDWRKNRAMADALTDAGKAVFDDVVMAQKARIRPQFQGQEGPWAVSCSCTM